MKLLNIFVIYLYVFPLAASAAEHLKPHLENSVQPHMSSEVVPSRGGTAQFSPLIERYILDELRSIRIDQERLRVEALRDITDRELNLAEEAMSYSTNTVTFFFYVFAIVGGALTLIGWRSFNDLKNHVRRLADREVARLSEEYEQRLTSLETELSVKGKIIRENQEQIEKTQLVHALWLRANQAPDPRTKIAFYDQILEITPNDYETIAYKADAALQLRDLEWALSLCNRILEENPENALAYYFRACAYAGLENYDIALADLREAIALSSGLIKQAESEEDFQNMFGLAEFQELIGGSIQKDPEANV